MPVRMSFLRRSSSTTSPSVLLAVSPSLPAEPSSEPEPSGTSVPELDRAEERAQVEIVASRAVEDAIAARAEAEENVEVVVAAHATPPAVWQVKLGGLYKPYDAPVQRALEEAFLAGKHTADISLRGKLYTVFLHQPGARQQVKHDPTKTRPVRRCEVGGPLPGVAPALSHSDASPQPNMFAVELLSDSQDGSNCMLEVAPDAITLHLASGMTSRIPLEVVHGWKSTADGFTVRFNPSGEASTRASCQLAMRTTNGPAICSACNEAASALLENIVDEETLEDEIEIGD